MQKETTVAYHVVDNNIGNPPRDRICWMRPNSDDWFILADSTSNSEQWYENFRVTRDTFTIILNEIEHDIAKQDTIDAQSCSNEKEAGNDSLLLCFYSRVSNHCKSLWSFKSFPL